VEKKVALIGAIFARKKPTDVERVAPGQIAWKQKEKGGYENRSSSNNERMSGSMVPPPNARESAGQGRASSSSHSTRRCRSQAQRTPLSVRPLGASLP
jgi:hypothetical protein